MQCMQCMQWKTILIYGWDGAVDGNTPGWETALFNRSVIQS